MMTTKTDRPQRKRRVGEGTPSSRDVPYTMKLDDGRTVFVEVPDHMAQRDRSGAVAFTPEGVRLLDRVRALASRIDSPPSPALITSLREAAGLTQAELGRRIGRDKLTISRWECGTMRPGRESIASLRQLFRKLKRTGVVLSA